MIWLCKRVKGVLFCFSSMRAKFPYLDFVYLLTAKEIKLRYKRTLLGFSWVLLNPFLQMLIIGTIFQFFVPMRVENYFLFLFAGLLPWGFFVNALLRSTPLLVQERSLIQKAAFPRELLVLSAVLANLFHTLVAVVVFLFFLAFLQSDFWAGLGFFFVSLSWSALFFLFLLFFTLATCLVVAALYVRFRDLFFVVQLLVQLLFYAVPVIYSLEMLPENFRNLLYLNPLVSFVEVFRAILLGLEFNGTAALGVAIFSILYLFFSIMFFHWRSKSFDDWF